jgi:riboflavin kinase / FMN adenylyltransferase
LIFIPFTPEFAATSYTDFIKNILIEKLHIKKLVIGYDHHFGKDRQGELKHLLDFGKQFNFWVEEISMQKIAEVAVSSTKIRKALLSGDIKSANNFLGYEYMLSGKVVKGDGIGRTLGYPTANIELDDPNKLIPAEGVYVVHVESGSERFGGMLSIGTRPTFNGIRLLIEVNIFNFDKNIYYENLCVRLIERFREEIKFGSIDKLKEQLLRDKEHSEKVLSVLLN